MQVDSMISELEKKFDEWKIGEKVGHGSGGSTIVYAIERKNLNFVEKDVLKVIPLLAENVGFSRMNEISRANYETQKTELRGKAEEEVSLMNKLKTSNYIVTYQDFKFLDILDENATSFVLAIRMHTYESLSAIIQTKEISQADIVKIGIDICCALEACAQYGIIHRDIKPENIFFDGDQYRLGDFGISRIIERGNLAHTNQGTPQFAAPEQFTNMMSAEGYDSRVDIYSLGLSLYYLANGQKLPFKDKLKGSDMYLKMRVTGAEIPPVDGIEPELNRIMLKACEHSADKRYQTPSEMKSDLQALYKKLKNRKSIKRIGGCGNINKNETEHAMPDMRNYSTDRALQGGDVISYDTQPADAWGRTDDYATQSAGMTTPKAGGYATERAMNTPETGGYATERAMNTPEAGGYATERAMNTPETGGYATEHAMNMPETGSAKYSAESDRRVKNSIGDNGLGTPVASIDTGDITVSVESTGQNTYAENDIAANDNTQIDTANSNMQASQNIRQMAISELENGNNDQAFKYYATLAEKEDWELMYHDVTKLFDSEQSISKRPQDALFWFTKCVECCKDSWTVSLAEFQLGDIYAKEIGVKKSHKLAEKYYRSSASKGNPYAKKKFVAGKYVK
nr:protein kinase [uncultured Agathobacter sp.]